MPESSTPHINRVLVLYSGGTLGMKRNADGVYAPATNLFLNQLKFHSEMHDSDLAKTLSDPLKDNQLIFRLPNGSIVLYQLEEYTPLLDSSNLSTNDWKRMAKDIELNYTHFNGFVILHGTDTMTFTASALSYMLDGLHKPVIITGAQIPIFEIRNDAKNNVLSAIILAGCYKIPEVCIFFANKLYRGNRTMKISCDEFDAFDSPNYHLLGDVGVQITLHRKFITRKIDKEFRLYADLNPNVGILYFFPTITPAILEGLLRPPVAGLVLQSYGSGNISMRNEELLRILADAIRRDVIIVNVTQCARGTVTSAYEGAKALEKIGVVSGYDMTVEAAFTKLCFVLAQTDLTHQKKIEMMKTNIRGELTGDPNVH